MHAAYLRVSTDEQNLDTQRGVIQDWLAQHGMTANWYEDKGFSGDTVRRPAFSAMRKDKGMETVVVFRLDRLSRKNHIGISLIHNWLEKGVRIVSVMDGIDLDPSDPNMQATIVDIIVPLLFGLAQNEQRVRKQRQRAGIERAKREGKYTGRKPQSYKVDPKRVHELKKRGWTDTEVAKQLGINRKTVYRLKSAV